MKPPPLFNSQDIIQSLLAGKHEVIDELYVRHRKDFFRWIGRRFDANRQDFEDAWQEALIAFYTQVISGKLTSLQCDVRTWLFAVGYKRMLSNNRKTKRIIWKDSIDETLRQGAVVPDMYGKPANEEKSASIQSALNTMSTQCRDILVARYYLEKSIEEIQQDWEYNSLNTTSATLSRCLKRLKDLIKTARINSKV